MAKNRINPETLLNLKASRHDLELCFLNFNIWNNKLKINIKINKEKILIPIKFLNKNMSVDKVIKYEKDTKVFIFFLNLIEVDFNPIISSSDIS